jgi:hypothetical protein
LIGKKPKSFRVDSKRDLNKRFLKGNSNQPAARVHSALTVLQKPQELGQGSQQSMAGNSHGPFNAHLTGGLKIFHLLQAASTPPTAVSSDLAF